MNTSHASLPSKAGLPSQAGLPLALAMALIVMVGLDLRPGIASIGPLLPLLRDDFQLSNTAVSVLTALPPLLMGLLALPAPWIANRIGLSRTVFLSLILVSVATLARAFSPSVGVLFLGTIGVSIGIALAGALIGSFVKARFPEKAALLVGIYAMSLGFGSTLAAGLTLPLVDLTEGWRFTAGAWALPGVLALVAWWLLTRRGTAETQAKPTSARLPLRDRAAWMIAVHGAANSILFFGFLAWIVPIFADFGAANPGLILTSFTLGFMLGNPVPGLFDVKDRRPLIALSGAVALAGIAGIALVPGLPFVFVPLLAFGVGASFTLSMTLPLDRAPDPSEAAGWNAMTLAFGYAVGAVGPLMVGLLHDLSGGYGLPLMAMAAVAGLMLALTPFLGPRPPGLTGFQRAKEA